MTDYSLPDFYVVGAQKSGTTSICSILGQHPKISISTPKETMFLCRDDVDFHSCFLVERSQEWKSFDWRENRDALLKRYEKLFPRESPDTLCGDGSTTYMPSKRAAERIASLRPDAKIIFVLRDPVDRASSAYWHYVNTGVVSRTFRNQLRFDGQGILLKGRYAEQIKTYMKLFPREQLYFELFERYVSNRQSVINGILQFLSLEQEIHVEDLSERGNRARIPMFHKTQLVLNTLKKALGGRFAAEDQYNTFENSDLSFLRRSLVRLIDFLSAYNKRNVVYPEIEEGLRTTLVEYYKRENRGLSELIDMDVRKFWRNF